MSSLTIDTLINTLQKEIKKGKLSGKDLIVLSRDEEGNGYLPATAGQISFYDSTAEELIDEGDLSEEDRKLVKRCFVLWP